MDNILAPIDARYSWSFDRYRLVDDDLPPGTDRRPASDRRWSGTVSAAAADQFRLLGVSAAADASLVIIFHRRWASVRPSVRPSGRALL